MASGNCVFAAPGAFAQDEEDGLVVVLRDDVPEDAEDDVRAAVRNCPSGAIAISDGQESR